MLVQYSTENVGALVEHVNANGIARDAIVAVVCNSSGVYTLLYWVAP